MELRKTNLLLWHKAEEMLTLKNENFAHFIHDQEVDKKEISANLHEDLAQGISGVLFILQVMKLDNSKCKEYISQAIEFLREILIKMLKLSHNITPTMADYIGPGELVMQFIEKIAAAYPFKIMVENTGAFKEVSADNTICAIRIIEQWLKVLRKKKNITKVLISVEYTDQFILSIQDDGAVESLTDRKKEVFESIVYDRVHAQGGTVELYGSSTEKNLLKVLLPLADHKAGANS
jgi:signal transduction histidine kinase